MAVQIVQYMDLRRAINVDPPSFHFIQYQDQISETEQRLLEAEKTAARAAEEADKLRQNLVELQLRGNSADSRLFTEPTPLEPEDDSSHLESRPSTKSSKQSAQPLKQKNQPVKPQQKSAAKVTVQKEIAESSVQDEGGDHSSAHVETRQSKRGKSTLDPVPESELYSEFPDKFELSDENSWATIPKDQIPGRFSQYRKLTQQKVADLEEQLNITLAKTQRKVNTLKSQFQEHKSKWEAERSVLIEQVEQAHKLQTEAEKEADDAMTQLEEFINEQERLEEEEEGKRIEISKGISRPVPKVITPPPPAAESPPPTAVATEGTEQELKNLMQQTDDAKAEARITSGAMSAPPAVEPEAPEPVEEVRKTQTDPELGTDLTDDDIRMASAQSRASLRSQYKNRLEETRHAIEERRSKSPAISVPSQRSLEEDQLVEEDDFPIPDEIKEEIEMEDRGTSPPPGYMTGRKQSTAMSRKLVEHPIVGEYLKTYEGVLSFKENLSRVMLDKEMLQASEILQDLDIVNFDVNSKVQPQLENMTKNVYFVLEEISSVLSSLLIGDREPLVSSLNGMMISRDQTRNTLQRDKSADSGRGQTMTRDSNSTRFPQSASSDKHAFKELQEAYERLESQLNQESKKHEEQMRHNTVVMMEMQDTINELQRELTALGRASSRMRPPSDGTTQQAPPESAIMFTRLDSERNSKIMKRAVNDERLEPSKYKDAVTTMDKYVSLPAKRFGHLVRKYVHHSRMKDIEENVKKSKSLDENVFDILDKMEALQNQRAKRWADKMDDMGSERLRLASLLMETLDSIEQESGIFLIKPMYSYRGREIKERYAGKLTRPVRPHRVVSPSREISAFAPAPTPASNIRGITRQQVQVVPEVGSQQVFRKELPPPLEGDETGIMGSPALAYATAAQRQTWNLSSSQVRGDGDNLMNSTNTPRILELDINRMLIGQNTISSKYGIPGLTDDRLINASQNNLRSYVTVNRPTVSLNRPRSYTGVKDVPPSSPVTRSLTSNSAGHKRVRVTESEISTRHSMTSTPPLPPISAHEGSDLREPPRSPPGSSLRVSTPPHIREVISPLK